MWELLCEWYKTRRLTDLLQDRRSVTVLTFVLAPLVQLTEMDRAAPTPAPPLVDVQSVRVQFANFLAVHDVSLTLRGGDLLGLIGPNGAGKTTLLRAVAGLQPTAAGQVRVLGELLEPGAPVMSRVGFTPDTPPLYEEMTVRTFLRFIAKGYGLSAGDVDAHISYWLERVWLTEKASQKVKALSRGMRQRLGLARTLLPNPSVVLLDEPAAGLDPAGRVQFRRLLCELRDQGKALIVSSHILADMAEYCTHIAIMERGALRRFGTVAEITASAAGAEPDRRRYHVTLARVVRDLREAVTAIDGALAVDADGDTFTVEWGHTPDDAAGLLKELVARGLPVASFTAEPVDLEQAYLRAGVRQVD
jgi:ABC-2 type transport system ATP-binding protein